MLALVGAAGAAPAGTAQVGITEIAPGEGREAVRNTTVQVHYTGWLSDGTKFDSSHDRGQPLAFVLGAGQVIPGWEMGLMGMREGGKRELVIPPHLGYGPAGAGDVIPPNATLRFEVELVAVEPPPFSDIDNAELSELIEQGVKVVDIRRPEEWRQTGVVEGSYLLTAFDANGRFVPSFPAELERIAAKDEPVVLICRTGSRTGVLARALAEQGGYQDVYNVEDGIVRWLGERRPVRKDCEAYRAGAQC
ncbi:FKBP-type peptidyl-prolyl cis-trans isomerase [Ectothiorhodospiraceae bacterium 2226]|nr:FKBP-type peptidyl-prolyl cis-trans isomerase [Ectothiorhodospiraceae bacterium 2226]